MSPASGDAFEAFIVRKNKLSFHSINVPSEWGLDNIPDDDLAYYY